MPAPLPYTLNANGRLIDLSTPRIMGILNVTPDSFYSESRKQTEREIAARIEQICTEGADIIDIGAYSTRPGHLEVSEEEEMRRLQVVLDLIKGTLPDAIVSVDTFRARVAERVVNDYGVAIINDISGGEDNEMFATTARLGVAYVLTWNGNENPFLYLSERIDRLHSLGQKDILLDPGFGFGKTLDENYKLMAHLGDWQAFDLPLLVGISRKSMIWKLLNITPEEALNGTTALHTLALERGASILRVHDVAAAREVIRIVEKMRE